ncbi:MAG: high light inducible protein [Cyanobacteria bacterium K_Offshore_surface_m2_011]|nr:high light inducible protein [Cyanobacteria bacterium K_Offshore_surface_m2_011]
MDEGSRQESGAGEGSADQGGQAFQYEPLERFGEGLTTSRPWNKAALAGVERLNGRVAMIGFLAALIGEELTGRGILGQLGLMLRWLLG